MFVFSCWACAFWYFSGKGKAYKDDCPPSPGKWVAGTVLMAGPSVGVAMCGETLPVFTEDPGGTKRGSEARFHVDGRGGLQDAGPKGALGLSWGR